MVTMGVSFPISRAVLVQLFKKASTYIFCFVTFHGVVIHTS